MNETLKQSQNMYAGDPSYSEQMPVSQDFPDQSLSKADLLVPVDQQFSEETQTENSSLLAGKFKTTQELEKAYLEISQALENHEHIVKELEYYRAQLQEEKKRHDADAALLGYASAEEKQFADFLRQKEYEDYMDVCQKGACREMTQEALKALKKYRISQKEEDLEFAKQFFPSEIVNVITRYTISAFEKGRLEIARQKEYRQMMEKASKLSQLMEKYKDWLKNQERRDIFNAAFGLANGDLDPELTIHLVESIENSAVREMMAKEKAKAENQELTENLNMSFSAASVPSGKEEGWITRAQFNAMSPEEYDKNYDRILKQIQLEKEGKLPRRLI